MTPILETFAKSMAKPSGGIPRGLARSGPALWSYGFRPFFLLAGTWAVLAMTIWIASLIFSLEIGGRGSLSWHAHEMLFGYTSAVLAGFMLTAIPNWTGRLPVSGRPLAMITLLWLLGRLAMVAEPMIGPLATGLVDGAFLPALALIAGREVVVGRNWKNLKILAGLGVLALANGLYHLEPVVGLEPGLSYRLAIAAYVMLIAVVGGRIVPSFTRNWLSRHGATRLPASLGRFDAVALVVTGLALLAWTATPETPLTAALAVLSAVLQTIRLLRWNGWAARSDALVFVLHVGYGFLPLGLLAIGLSALGIQSPASALHVLTVGAIGSMTFAVMSRAALGHTGRALRATPPVQLAYVALALAGLARPLAEMLPDIYLPILSASGALWILAFGLFLFVYAPILLRPGLTRP